MTDLKAFRDKLAGKYQDDRLEHWVESAKGLVQGHQGKENVVTGVAVSAVAGQAFRAGWDTRNEIAEKREAELLGRMEKAKALLLEWKFTEALRELENLGAMKEGGA